MYLLTQLISTLRWKLLLPEVLGIRKLFSLYMIGAFFNTLLPGVIGGDAVKGFYLYKTIGRGGLTLASIFMDRYIGFVVLIAICTIAFPFGYKYFHGSRIEWLLPFAILSFTVLSLLILGLRLGKRIKIISGFYDYFHAYRNQKTVINTAFRYFCCLYPRNRYRTAYPFSCMSYFSATYNNVYHSAHFNLWPRCKRKRFCIVLRAYWDKT
jgi:uncharacterized protein (TIRG00374 family)